MVSIGANERDVPDPERMDGGAEVREAAFLDEKGSAIAEDRLFCGEDEKPLLPLVAFRASGFSNADLAGEEIGGRAVSGIEGADAELRFEDEKVEGRGVTGTEERGDGVCGTFADGIGPRTEDEALPCCCGRDGFCGPDCAVLPL